MSEVRKFEALNYALRKTKDGIVVSFLVHPSDLDDELTCLPIGSRVVIGWMEFNDEEPPASSNRRTADAKVSDNAGSTPAAGSKKERKRFAELPASQQAAMLCDDKRFQEFLFVYWSAGTPWRWTWDREGDSDEEIAAKGVRAMCGVKSRADIPTNPVALERWQSLLSRYESWKLEQAYPEGAR